jgi:RNA polymerase sigma factor (sigma-70 family)
MSFRDTRWTLLDAAREGDDEAHNEIARLYRQPVVRFLQAAGAGADAEDLTQEVFVRLFQDVLVKTDRSAGRFRNLLLAVTRNVLRAHRTKASAKKRGGDRAALPLNEQLIPAAEEAAFDREWILALIERALDELARDNPSYHAVMVLHLSGTPNEQIASQLDCTPKDVRNRLHRARKALGRFLRAAAWNYSANPQDHATELEILRGYLPVKGVT